MSEAVAKEFEYRPPFVTRMAERFFPQWGAANRQAALQAHLFDAASRRPGFQQGISQFAASYDILHGDRSRKGYVRGLSGSGDVHLTEQALSDMRELARDASRNDPIVKGVLTTYAEGIVGTEVPIEARSSDEKWNAAREQLWRERMIDQPCEITGRFNFPHSIYLAVLSYSRDGDFLVVNHPEGVMLCEGEQCGSPLGIKDGDAFHVTNGVATEKTTGRVIGYYLGRPNKWGYIEASGYTKWTADQVHHVFDPDRISYTRGEPLLTPSIQWFDKGARFADATLVTSCVQACQGIAIKHKNPESLLPGAIQHKANSEVNAEDSIKRFVMAPGMVWDLDDDADVANIGPEQPTSVFGDFMNRVLMIAGRSAGLPLMLITQDLSGATFMNARIAAQMAQERWRKVQAYVVSRLASRWYLWQTERDIASKDLQPAPGDWRAHEVRCRRWPYVDPEKEAKAVALDLENGMTDPLYEASCRGRDYRDIVRGRVKAQQIEKEEGLEERQKEQGQKEKDQGGEPDGKTDE